MTTISDDDFVRLFQTRFGITPVDGWAGNETLAMLDKVAPPKPVPAGSPVVAMPDNYWPLLETIESGGRIDVQAATSSASGLYQFLKATWENEGGKWGPTVRPAFGGLKPTREEQLARVKTFTAKNAAYLAGKGVPINRASLYAAHFLGKVTAAAIIAADTGARADLIAGEAATKANEGILRGKTVWEFLSWLYRKTGDWAR